MTLIISANAQGFSYGPQIGVSTTNIIEKTATGNIEKNLRIGYQFGAAAEFEIMSFLYVAGAVTFFEKGDRVANAFGTSKLKLGYIDIPITIGYKMPIGNVSVFGNVGPYSSVAIVGKSHYTSADGTFSENMPIQFGETWGYKRFDSGVTFGGGVEFKQYQVKANYSLGFIDINSSDFVTARNSVLNITATYFFGRNF